jgi:hypothetical protein
VSVRAADSQTDLSSQPFLDVQNTVSFCDAGINGRYIETRVYFSREPAVTATPVLFDLSINCCLEGPVAKCKDVTVNAAADCAADASVDDGSSSPDGNPVTLVQTPPGPYSVGTTEVTLTVTDDVSGLSASCQANVTVVDLTPPTAQCVPTTNPAGEQIPKAGNNPKSGQNPDGFYQVLATDNCDSNPQIWVYDSASSFVAGPYHSGDKLKITQSPGGTPVSEPMDGVIVAHLKLKGDARMCATDASANAGVCASCLIPPRPR